MYKENVLSMKLQLILSIETESLSPSPSVPGESSSRFSTANIDEIFFRSNGQLFSTITDQRHLNLNNEARQAFGGMR